uniref:Cytochrome c oxidase assembly factor 4 homolog n=1 Tax=Equus caballus TaxID=9796 RepID=A0A9L0RWJ7_HORSE
MSTQGHTWVRQVKKEDEEEDPLDQLISRSGCAASHYAVQECMAQYQDWRQCQAQFDSFRKIALDYFQENLCKCSTQTADLQKERRSFKRGTASWVTGQTWHGLKCQSSRTRGLLGGGLTPRASFRAQPLQDFSCYLPRCPLAEMVMANICSCRQWMS